MEKLQKAIEKLTEISKRSHPVRVANPEKPFELVLFIDNKAFTSVDGDEFLNSLKLVLEHLNQSMNDEFTPYSKMKS